MNFEDIILSEISQSPKEMLYESTYMRYLKQSKTQKKRKYGGNQGLGVEENGELLFNGYRVSVLQYEKVLEICWIPTQIFMFCFFFFLFLPQVQKFLGPHVSFQSGRTLYDHCQVFFNSHSFLNPLPSDFCPHHSTETVLAKVFKDLPKFLG